jgi:hypothetical protein
MTSVEAAVRVVVDLLVRRDYVTIELMTRGRRLPADELKRAIEDYGRTLCEPANGWWSTVEVTELRGARDRTLHVAAPLWTEEEGRSDLTLELRLIEIAAEAFETEIENLHVPELVR